MLHLHTDAVLEITIHSAHGLQDVERGGKNDCYARVAIDLEDKKAFQKTDVKKNSGSDPTWEELVVIREVKPEHTYLYVEILDEETGIDAPIAFAAIPLAQVNETNKKSLSARYDVYNENKVAMGEISLTIRIVQPGQESSGRITYDGENFKKGQSEVDEQQLKRFKKLLLADKAQDVGATGALLGGFAALGAGFMARQKAEAAKQRDAALAEGEQ
ncbi:hypothetical protein BGX24_009592 [Mortierella sp. AD032]|nr:hypothetical protein BGX24_009592 [Mortierella sp. AD032]